MSPVKHLEGRGSACALVGSEENMVARLLALPLGLLVVGCSAVWGLDEVVLAADGGGGSASSSASASTGEGGGEECGCGCPSLFARGDFESQEDVDGFSFDVACTARLDELDDGCHAMTMTGTTYCAHEESVPEVIEGDGLCASAHFRARSLAGGWIEVALVGESPEFVQITLTNLSGAFDDWRITCALPAGFVGRKAYLNTNKGGADGPAELSIDYVELSVVDCVGDEPACETFDG
jgi:hypothetical protein